MPHEGRPDGIAQQLLHPGGHPADPLGRNGQEIVLLGPRPGLAVLVGDGQSRCRTPVGPAPVDQGAGKHQAGPRAHQHGPRQRPPQVDRLRRRHRVPQMASGQHFGGPVLGREVVHRQDHAETDGRPGPGQTIEAVVHVKRLRALPRTDVDRLAGGEQIARQEVGIEEGEQAGILRQFLEQPAPGDQGIDPLRIEALEVIAPRMPAEVG